MRSSAITPDDKKERSHSEEPKTMKNLLFLIPRDDLKRVDDVYELYQYSQKFCPQNPNVNTLFL